MADVPILGMFHGEDANLEVADPRYQALFERWFTAPGSVALGVAEHLTCKLVKAGFPAERAFTQHLGIDLDEYAPRSTPAGGGGLRLLLSGRLIEVKGHATALRALALVRKRQPETTMDFFGSGPLEPKLRAVAKELGVHDAVRFHGAVPVHQLRERMVASDLLLQPSQVDSDGREEGVPNSILEAMALGLAVVATEHGGIPEAVTDGETGRLVPERDSDALARAIHEAADPAVRARYARAGRAKIEAEFDQVRCGEGLGERIGDAREIYLSLSRSLRRERWRASLSGYVELPSEIGRRERLHWPLPLLANRFRGNIP